MQELLDTQSFTNISVFSDFDGTIALKDIGDEIFIKFGRIEPFHTRLFENKITIYDYWHKLCDNLDEGVSRQDLIDFALCCGIDPNFKTFAEFCRKNEINLTVLSDGFDTYIDAILGCHSLDWIEVYSNKLLFENSKKPAAVFPYASESCGCMAASCKRNSMLNGSGESDILIYIGDGHSDFCAAEHADIIFAKGKLAAYCNAERLPHYPFSTFFDIKRVIEGLLKRGLPDSRLPDTGLQNKRSKNARKFKIRHQAFLKRKKAFETE